MTNIQYISVSVKKNIRFKIIVDFIFGCDIFILIMNDQDFDNIRVPRDFIEKNKGVTKEIENYLFDVLTDNPEEPFHVKDLFRMVHRKFSNKYGDDLLSHTAWALNMLAFNKLAKKVAPGTWESYDGPDDEIERAGGYAPEGEFARRSYRVYGPISGDNKLSFKHYMDKAEMSVKMLKNMGDDRKTILNKLSDKKNFHPVAVKLAIKKIFGSY
jgi:hypothetical protein